MYRELLVFLFAAAVFATAACTDAAEPRVSVNSAGTPASSANTKPAVDEHGHENDAPRITLADAKKDFDAGAAVFIDTRGPDNYKAEHVKGALNITTAEIGAKADTIPKGKKIIAYCS